MPCDAPVEIMSAELHHMLTAGKLVCLLDVREPWEHQIARIERAELIPMQQIPEALNRLGRMADPLVIYCHHGVRSMFVAVWLRQRGIYNAQTLQGGIDRWSQEIDPAIPRYV